MQVKIEKINKRDTDKSGQPLISKKYGTPYYNIGIAVEGQEGWMSCFANRKTDPEYLMEEGGTYSIAITEKPNPSGGVYKNFKLLTPEEKEVEDMKAELAALKAAKAPEASAPAAEPEVNLDSF